MLYLNYLTLWIERERIFIEEMNTMESCFNDSDSKESEDDE